MAVREIDLKDFSQVLGSFTEDHLDFIRGSVVRGIVRALPMLAKNSPVDTGQYASSWDYSFDKDSATVGNYAPHAPIIEFGARPFRPPLKPLLQWAKRVLQDPSQPPDYSNAVWGLAIYTRNKIEKYGQKPKHIMMNQIPNIIGFIDEELKRAI